MKKLFFLLLCFSFPVWAIECPTDRPMEKDNECYPCIESENLFSKEECDKCPEFRKFENGSCIFTRSPYLDKPLLHLMSIISSEERSHEEVYFESCDYLKPVLTTAENCSFCSNRKYEDGWCILKECPENYLWSKGGCYECSDVYSITTSKENCDTCSNRIYENGKCILKKCPKDYPIRRDGTCFSCDSPYLEHVSESECSLCRDFEYVRGGCFSKEFLKQPPMIDI